MSMTDPVADMLTRIRNAGLARLENVEIPTSKLKKKIAEILEAEGYIASQKLVEGEHQGKIEIELKYDSDKSLVIRNISRVSKPGRRVYARCDDIPKIKNGLGVCIVSTSQGVMSDRQARRLGIGGELVCQVW